MQCELRKNMYSAKISTFTVVSTVTHSTFCIIKSRTFRSYSSAAQLCVYFGRLGKFTIQSDGQRTTKNHLETGRSQTFAIVLMKLAKIGQINITS